MEAVCSDENVSVDMEKITAAHSSAGHHESSHLTTGISRM
jgi:hypothetical protein